MACYRYNVHRHLISGTVLCYLPSLFTNKVIICDRWVYDIMVDLEVDTHIRFFDCSRLKRLFLSLLPFGSTCFVIEREQSLIRSARDESFNDDNFPVRCDLYLRHAKDGKLHPVDNNGGIEQTDSSAQWHS